MDIKYGRKTKHENLKLAKLLPFKHILAFKDKSTVLIYDVISSGGDLANSG